jgi:hypothetical protein
MSRKRKRESKGARWKRARAWKRLSRDVGVARDDENHLRIDVDSQEFACLFTLEGGRDEIGPGVIRATDRFGRKPGIRFGGREGVAVAAHHLGMDRGKVGRMVAQWKDAEAIIEIRARLRRKKLQERDDRLDRAVQRDAIGWYRQNGDVEQRSILLGTNRGADPLQESDGLITTYRTETGEYAIAREFWNGDHTSPDENGDRHRAGVVRDRLPVTFRTAREAQLAFFHAVDMGETLNFESGASLDFGSIRSSHRVANMAERLSRWERNGVDMKKAYDRPRPQKPTKTAEGKKVIVGTV